MFGCTSGCRYMAYVFQSVAWPFTPTSRASLFSSLEIRISPHSDKQWSTSLSQPLYSPQSQTWHSGRLWRRESLKSDIPARQPTIVSHNCLSNPSEGDTVFQSQTEYRHLEGLWIALPQHSVDIMEDDQPDFKS